MNDLLISQTIRLILDSIGRSEEYEYYLRKFRSEHSQAFAIIVPDYETTVNASEALHVQLDFIRRLELLPVVLLCGPEHETMQQLLLKADLTNLYDPQLIESSAQHPIEKTTIADLLRQAQQKKQVAVLALNRPLTAVLSELTVQISQRLLFVRMAGALKNSVGENISFYRVRKNHPQLAKDDHHWRSLALTLLSDQRPLHLAITSPLQLLKEIFTVKGSGSLLRRGSYIQHFNSLVEIDGDRLKKLLENSFRRELKDFTAMAAAISDIYLEEHYRGAILLNDSPWGKYLSKFAVTTGERGDGVALELWEQVAGEHPALFWRSRLNNAINRWYGNLADGQFRYGKWIIFCRGIKSDDLSAVIKYCNERAEDFAF